jgi:uncharacterized ion transporter superfamily protein YfcC
MSNQAENNVSTQSNINNNGLAINKKKKKFKIPTPYTIIFFLLVFVVLLTWIMDWANVTVLDNGETFKITGAGIIDVFTAPFQAFVNKSNILIFILSIGAFSFLVMESKSLDAVTQKLVKKMGDHSIWIIPIFTFMLSFFGSTYGMCEESLGFLFVLCPLMLATGFDVVTAVLMIIMGVDLGTMMASTDPFLITPAVSATNDAIGHNAVAFADGIAFRLIAWVIITLFAIAYVTGYAIIVKKNPKRSVVFADMEGHKKFFLHEKIVEEPLTKKRLAIAIIYLISFLVMITYLVSWDGLLSKADLFDGDYNNPYIQRWTYGDITINSDLDMEQGVHYASINDWLQRSPAGAKFSDWAIAQNGEDFDPASLFTMTNDPSTFGPMMKAQIWMHNHFPYFAGFTPGLGLGDLNYVSGIFFIASIVVGSLTWAGEEKFSQVLVDGARDVLGVVFMISLAGGINVIFQQSGMSDAAAHGMKLSGMNPYLFIIMSYLVFIPISFAIPSSSGFATAIFPIWGPAANQVTMTGSITATSGSITAFSFANGWANLFSPATGLVMGACAMAKVNYVQFLKAIWPAIVITFFLNIILLVMGTGMDLSSGAHLF